MRRIDAEYDIPQFVAASLVRTIATSNFRLPESKRDRFQRFPDDVIARVEEIVRHAYSGAGEDVSIDTLTETIKQQATTARHKMVADGALLTLGDFAKRIGTSAERLDDLLADGSVFSVCVDEALYVPAALAGSAQNRRRLHAVCRILLPAPPMCRLDFLTSKWSSLDDRSPLELLDNDHDFRLLRKAATAWAAEYSRTAVKIYDGKLITEPKDTEPLYTAMVEVDPRRPVWTRAAEALHVPGFQQPLGPCTDARLFSLFVVQLTAGSSAPISESCVQIEVDGEFLRFEMVAVDGSTLQSGKVASDSHTDLIETAKRVIKYLSK